VQLEHVEWQGFHFYDLIFPLFLFLIGVSIPLALGKRLARGDSLTSIYKHIVLRVAILIVLAMMVNGRLLTYDPSKFALSYSVLQMLALGYLVASLLFLNLRLGGQVVATVVMLVRYWALLAFVPGPGHEIGQFANVHRGVVRVDHVRSEHHADGRGVQWLKEFGRSQPPSVHRLSRDANALPLKDPFQPV
jgi:predicted acyltransferase